jgi:rhamnogalacturonyl hydrolase YesR
VVILPLIDSNFDDLLDRTLSLYQWVEANGLSGYDPYDVLGDPRVIKIVFSPYQVMQFLPARICNTLIRYFPGPARKVFGIKPQINAKGVGLFASAFLQLFLTTKDGKYRESALEILDWLMENPSRGYHGFCWGYPFDWQSRIFIPKGTPSSVVSYTIGEAFWTAYQVLGKARFLEVCVGICEFFMTDLNRSFADKNRTCFSYTPLDNFQVNNANLFVSEFLIRIGKETGNLNYTEEGLKAARFTLDQQHANGSLDYWARAQNVQPPNRNDHYHVGFETRSLFKIWKHTGDQVYFESTQKYYEYYVKNLIEKNGNYLLPKMYPHSAYPIDVHACSEAIILNTLLSDTFREAQNNLSGLYAWIVNNMQSHDGSFYHRIYSFGGIRYIDRTPYMRWGQAWMLYALSLLLTKKALVQNRM